MSIFLRHKKHATRIELAPFIDIIFVLLIFFAVSSSLLIQNHGLQLLLPKAISSAKHKKTHSIYIDKSQQIFMDKVSIALHDITAQFIPLVKQQADVQVILSADKEIPYQRVIQVLDKIRLSGCHDIVLATKKH